MPERTRARLLEELETLNKRLEERERAMARHKEAEASAQKQLVELSGLIDEYRKELKQARRISRSLAHSSQQSEQASKGFADAFELFCSYTSDLVFRVKQDGRVIYLSPSCIHLLGIPGRELQGRRLWELLEGISKGEMVGFLKEVAERGNSQGQEWAWKTREGVPLTMAVYCQAVPHPQTGETEVLAMARPVASKDPPSQASAGSEAWIAALVHELKQPLTAIVNYTQACLRLVQGETREQAELLLALEQTGQQADRAAELIKRWRLGVPAEAHRSTVKINDLVRDTLQALQADLRSNEVQMELDLAKELPQLRLDRMQIGQVLINLVRNAIEALEKTPTKDRRIRITTRATETDVEVVVRDTGEGLAPDLTNRLFEPFQTTKPHGMGLGLALSRAMVQAHGGRLWVESHADQGTSFTFTLPKAYEQ